MLKDLLTLTGSVVTVIKKTVTPDGFGDATTTSTITGLPRAAIWSPSQSKTFISDKITKMSTHVLVTIPSDYAFSDTDVEVTYDSKTYRITGPSDDVMEKGEIMVTGLERLA